MPESAMKKCLLCLMLSQMTKRQHGKVYDVFQQMKNKLFTDNVGLWERKIGRESLLSRIKRRCPVRVSAMVRQCNLREFFD